MIAARPYPKSQALDSNHPNTWMPGGRAAAALIWFLSCLFFCPAQAGQLGANALYLLSDYLPGSAAMSESGEDYRFIRREMAKKSISDARAAGFTFVRVGLTGYRPIGFDDKLNDLAVWQDTPAAFWAATDDLFDELDKANIRIVPTLAWNIIQFPALGGDDLSTFLRDPNSRSRALFAKFVTEFVTRYKDRSTILFYELGNEWNLDADIDLQKICRDTGSKGCVWHNFSTDELVAFSRDAVSLIKRIDPSRKVASGYSLPRPAASHLRSTFNTSSAGAWRNDSAEEYQNYLLYLNEPFDIVSVHIYPPAADRFGGTSGLPTAIISLTMSAVKSVGKQLFVGEFGDSGATPFLRRFLYEIVEQHVDYAAIWVWEFYQTSTYETHNTEPSKYSIEPGYYDGLIALLVETEKALGRTMPRSLERPNVILTWPLPCARVDQITRLAAVASDGARGVKGVEFLVNGQRIAVVASPPYYAEWDPVGLGKTNIEIEARATSDAGMTAAFKTEVRANGSKAACHITRN